MNRFIKLSFVVVLMIGSVTSFGQLRTLKLKLEIKNPAPFTEVRTPQEIPVSYKIYNVGIDTLWPCDSILVLVSHWVQPTELGVKRWFRFDEDLLPGDSTVLFRDTLSIDRSQDIEDREFGLFTMFGSIITDINCMPVNPNTSLFINDEITLIHKVPTLSINTIELENEISVYPNPSDGSSISIVNEGNSRLGIVRVQDILGNTILDGEAEELIRKEYVLLLPDLEAGMYVLSIETSSGWFTTKIMIQ
jgi:hypothetical protein